MRGIIGAGRRKARIFFPKPADGIRAVIGSRTESREKCRAQRGGLGYGWPFHRRAKNVCKKLHEPIVLRHGPIDAKPTILPESTGRLEEIMRLISDRLQTRSHNVSWRRVT